MSIYYFVMASVLILGGFAQRVDRPIITDDNHRHFIHSYSASALYIALALILIAVAGLRYYVGTDYGAYYRYYAQYADTLGERIRTLSEPGYSLLAKVAVWMGKDGAWSVFFASLITAGLNTRTIYRYTDKLLYAVLLYLFLGCWHGEFNAVRQCLAGAFVFSGYRFLRDKRFWQYLFCVFLAFLCHRSSILMIIPFFLVRRRISVGNTVLLIIGTVALVLSEEFVFSSTSALLETALDEDSIYVSTSVNVLRTMVGISPSVFFYSVLWSREKTMDDIFHLNLLLFHAAVSIATMNSTYYARYTIYTAPFLSIAIPELSKRLSNRNRGLISFSILALYFGFWIYELINSSSLNQFRFIWER